MAAQVICPNCGTIGRPKTVTEGSFLIELVMWLFFLIPGLIYSLWRITNRNNACRTCKGRTLVPVETPGGRALVQKFAATTPPPPPPSVIDFGFLRLVDGRVAALNLGFTKLAGRSAVWAVRGCVIFCVLFSLTVLYMIANRGSAAANAKQRETERRMAEIRARIPTEPVARQKQEPVQQAVATEPEPTETEIWVILRDNEKNHVAAEDRWIDKRIRLRGKVHDIQAVSDKTAIVQITSEDGTSHYTASCDVGRGEAALLKLLDPVTISGRVRRIGHSNIQIDRCRFE